MISLTKIEKSAKGEAKVTEMTDAQDDPYDIEKCARWIRTNALKQV